MNPSESGMLAGVPLEMFVDRRIKVNRRGSKKSLVRGRLIELLSDNQKALFRPYKHGHEETVSVDDLYPWWSANPDLLELSRAARRPADEPLTPLLQAPVFPGVGGFESCEVIACALCEKEIYFQDSYAPEDEAICAECDTEVTGRKHPPSVPVQKDLEPAPEEETEELPPEAEDAPPPVEEPKQVEPMFVKKTQEPHPIPAEPRKIAGHHRLIIEADALSNWQQVYQTYLQRLQDRSEAAAMLQGAEESLALSIANLRSVGVTVDEGKPEAPASPRDIAMAVVEKLPDPKGTKRRGPTGANHVTASRLNQWAVDNLKDGTSMWLTDLEAASGVGIRTLKKVLGSWATMRGFSVQIYQPGDSVVARWACAFRKL